MNKFVSILILIGYLFTTSHAVGVELCHRFVVITPEKTGTHLLTKAISQLTGLKTINCWDHNRTSEFLINLLEQAKNEDAFLHMHAFPHEHIINTFRQRGHKVIFLMRDPRDQAISLLFYLQQGWQYGPITQEHPFRKLSFDEQLLEIITGERFGLPMTKNIIGERIPWMRLKSFFVCTVKFENLVGHEGGGSDKAQQKELKKICKHIGLKLSKTQIKERSAGLFGKPGEKTFRSGQIGEWKKYFKDEHINAFKNHAGEILILTGYEKNLNW